MHSVQTGTKQSLGLNSANMSVLLVTYQINNAATDKAKLFGAIKENANGGWHYIENTWIVNTSWDNADALSTKLRPYINDNYRLLVVKITSEHQGWLPTDAWKWLLERDYT